MMKAYKFRLYPNNSQRILINKTFGCTRFIYNYFLDKQQKEYKDNKKKISAYDCCKEVKDLVKEKEWLSEVDSCALRCAIFDLEDAFNNFFRKTGKYPVFKKRGVKSSYRTNCIINTYKETSYSNIQVDLNKNIIKLPKLKEVKIRGYRGIKEIRGGVYPIFWTQRIYPFCLIAIFIKLIISKFFNYSKWWNKEVLIGLI